MSARVSRADRFLEAAIAALSLHALVLAVFRRYGLPWMGFQLSADGVAPVLLVLLALFAYRAWRNRRRSDPPAELHDRWRPGHWLDGLGFPGLVLIAFFFFVFFLFNGYGGRLGGDGVINFIYARSLVIDGDLDLTNEFAEFVPAKFQVIAEGARALGKSPDPSNEPGPALFWTPAFLATHWLVLLARSLGSEIPADGYSYPYINAVCLSGLLWGFVAVVIAYLACKRYFAPLLAAVSIGVLWLSSTLLWYTVQEPSMPHATAAAVVSFFLLAWLRVREAPSTSRWVVLGVAGGLVLSMQRYGVFYLIAPLATAASTVFRRFRERDRAIPKRWWRGAVLVAVAFLGAASPMLLYNLFYSREGSFLRMGDLGGFTLRYWDSPRIGEFLFSSNHGLFAWTPSALVSLLGLFVLLRKDARLAMGLLFTLAAGVYLLSSTWDWYAGHAFGSRRLTEAFPIFALGFCGAMELLLKSPRILAAVAMTGLIFWNFLLAGQVKRGDIPMMGTFAFSEASERALRRFYEVAGHPGSIPANWLFSWKYGVAPSRFDWIYGHREYHNLDVRVGDPEDRYFIGRGWSVRETSSDGATFRWSSASESTMLVTLFEPFDYRLRATVEPSTHPDQRRQVVFVSVNGHIVARLGLNDGWQTVESPVPASFWRAGLNEVELRYAWTVRASEVYGVADDRQIAIKLARFELETVERLE
ncbi:MAG TPA: glycosyltransferase family 39 protein [Vicinamibacteria bacterium]|nr:glycosyltransferase family 39 protein [Vicinamibacteria bacterium]